MYEDFANAADRLPFAGGRSNRAGDLRPGIARGRRKLRGRLRTRARFLSPPATGSPDDRDVQMVKGMTHLADRARLEAATHDWPCTVEFAAGSESTYVHVLRNGFWYGIRMSSHLAVYGCSRDYAQLILPKSLSDRSLRAAADVIASQVCAGGLVVAAPQDVRREMLLAEVLGADGGLHETDDGVIWKWSAKQRAWQRMDHGSDESCEPPFIPRQALSTGESAAIRHRMNQREKWVASERGVEVQRTQASTDCCFEVS